MAEVVKKYSVPPYNVRYIQIWNEQDAPYDWVNDSFRNRLLGEQSYHGDHYYGGEYYGEMLKRVYPKDESKQTQSVQVLTGCIIIRLRSAQFG
jgi:hypothetical protein